MKPAKIIGVSLLGIIAVIALAYAGAWLLGERIVGRTYKTPNQFVTAAAAPEAIEEGRRLAYITGCLGCHGEDLNGQLFGEDAFIFRSVASNLPRLAKTYTDEDFARAIRHGVKKDRKSVIGMPSPAFFDLRDEDLSAILGYLRTLQDKEAELPTTEVMIGGRLAILLGLYAPEASTIDHYADKRRYDLSNVSEHGAYLAQIACAECHGLDLSGDPDGEGPGWAPDLIIAGAYPLEDFTTLMRTGMPIGGRDLELMDDVARHRFSRFTEAEVAALHAFLVARADGE